MYSYTFLAFSDGLHRVWEKDGQFVRIERVIEGDDPRGM